MAKEFIFFGGACHKAIKVFACFFIGQQKNDI